MTKEDTISPIVATKALMLRCAIDVRGKRDVATIDIHGVFIHVDMEGEVDMKLERAMADMCVKLDPKLYKQYIRRVRRKSVIYVRLNKALYG